MTVTTRGVRPVERACNSRLEEMRAVVNSVSAAVPAPAHQMLGEMKCNFSQFYLKSVSVPQGERVES